MKKTQSGFSLLELLLVVGVGALLLLAGLATYRLVSEGNNVNTAIQVLNTLKTQTQRTFQSQGDYDVGNDGDSLVTILANAGAFPSGVLNQAGTPIDPWGNTITITQVTATGTSFEIGLSNLPRSACVKLAMAFDPTTDPDVEQVEVGSTTFDTAGTTALTISSADGACVAASASNDITYRFY